LNLNVKLFQTIPSIRFFFDTFSLYGSNAFLATRLPRAVVVAARTKLQREKWTVTQGISKEAAPEAVIWSREPPEV